MSKPSKVTSKRVAELAGVSQTTVSFVLNNVESANISQDTKDRVWDAAKQLGYVPDVRARSLAGGKSSNIALILGQAHQQVFIDEYIPNILTGISQITRPEHYRIVVELVEEDGPSTTVNNLIRGNEIAGMIVNFNNPLPGFIEQLNTFAAEGFPVVGLAGAESTHSTVLHSVMVDKLSGVRVAVQHLVNLGYQRIGCITYGPLQTQLHVRERLSIYRDVLESAGLPFDQGLIREGNYDPDTGYAAMQDLLQSAQPLPDALFAMNDVIAIGAMKAIHDVGLRIPEDIAVIGFDDMRLAGYITPSLSTIREPDILHGSVATEMLFRLMRGQPIENKHIVLNTELKIRESCGAKLKTQVP